LNANSLKPREEVFATDANLSGRLERGDFTALDQPFNRLRTEADDLGRASLVYEQVIPPSRL